MRFACSVVLLAVVGACDPTAPETGAPSLLRDVASTGRIDTPDTTVGQAFGQVFSAKGDRMAAIIQAGDGRVDVYGRVGTTWSRTVSLPTQATRAPREDIAIDGDVLVVGTSPISSTGPDGAQAWIRNGAGTWLAPTTPLVLPANRPTGHRCGSGVAAAGDLVAVGCPDNGSTPGKGVVGLWRREGADLRALGGWRSSQPANGTGFGTSVALDGDLLVVGEPGVSTGNLDNAGAIEVYRVVGDSISLLARLTSPTPVQSGGCGYDVDISGDRIAATCSVGHALVWRRVGDDYVLEGTLDTGETGPDTTGVNVDLRGGFAVLGTQYHDGVAARAGAAWLFREGPSGWALDANLRPGSIPTFALFGFEVRLLDTEILVGAPYIQGFSAGPGAILRFPLNADVDQDGIAYYDDCDDDSGAVGRSVSGGTDLDDDGFASGDARLVCAADPDVAATMGDCDDADPRAYPGATEVIDDGVDQDCDGGDVCHADGDGDGAISGASIESNDLDCGDPGESSGGPFDCADQEEDIGPLQPDTCGDGLDSDCDGVGTDSDDEDGDGLTGNQERVLETLLCDPDTDDDDVEDGVEVAIGTDPTLEDSDSDDLNDGAEIAAGTDPNRSDTDGDGLDDGDEATAESDPLDPDSDDDGLLDGDDADPNEEDSDDDGILDGVDPDPGSALGDADDDGRTDAQERADGTDPHRADTDGDGLDDGDEATAESDPLDPDSDNDGLLDGDDPDPDNEDTDNDGIIDGLDPDPGSASGDADTDGRTDAEERADGTDPNRADTDGDGLNDGAEATAGTDPLDPDSDNDGLLDGEEGAHNTDPTVADTDDDGLSDGDEVAFGTDPTDPDSDADGLNDGDEIAGGTDPLDPDEDADGLIDGQDDEITPMVGGCGCATPAGSPVAGLILAGLVPLIRRRRRS